MHYQDAYGREVKSRLAKIVAASGTRPSRRSTAQALS
jgi:hypothetical protein